MKKMLAIRSAAQQALTCHGRVRRKTVIRAFLILFLAGVAMGTLEKPLWALYSGGMIALLVILVLCAKNALIVLPILSTALIAGYLLADSVPKESPAGDIGQYANNDGEEVELTGQITEFPDKRYGRTKWVVSVHTVRTDPTGVELPVTGKVLVQTGAERQLDYGDMITVGGKLMTPFETEEFSYKKYLSRQQIFAVMNYPEVTVKEKGQTGHLKQSLYELRQWFDRELKKQILPPESAFAGGILIGDRSGFSPVWEERFRISGLSHMLALSGYNITIIILTMFHLFRVLPKRIRILITIAFLGAFVIFVGGGSSIIRAAVMGAIGMFVIHSGRDAEGADLLLLASAIMVAWQPLILLYDPSFQLSVAGVTGLLLFAGPFHDFFRSKTGKGLFTEILSATLAAQLGVMPLIMFLFGEISLISPISNLAVSPLIPLAMLVSFLAIVTGGTGYMLAEGIGFVAWNILHFCLWVVRLAAELPYAGIHWRLDLAGLIACTLLLACLAVVLRRRTEKA